MRKLGILAVLIITLACGHGTRPPEPSPLQREFMPLPAELMPLFVLGDVNEDSRVDSLDRALVARLAGTPGDSAGIACRAAADVTRDGMVDRRDVAAHQTFWTRGDSAGLALYRQPGLPCAYSGRVLAAPAEWRSDVPIRLRLLQRHTTREATLTVLRGRAEAEPLTDESGWDLRIDKDQSPDSLVVVLLRLAGVRYFYTLAGSADSVEKGDDFIEAGGPENGMTGPPPTIWGEEIAGLTTCPQKGKGCEALVIDFMKVTWDVDVDMTRRALADVGCHLTYVAPSFLALPEPVYLGEGTLLGDGAASRVDPPPEAVAAVMAANRAEWIKVRDAVDRHRALVGEERELVIQLVAGHGSNSARYGDWGPEFDTGAGTLSRQEFHVGNYRAERGKACYAVAIDRSCYSGNTPAAVDRINNTGAAIYFQPPAPPNHGYHAAFRGDMAASLSSTTTTCNNGDGLAFEFRMREIIRQEGKNGDFDRLAAIGFRSYVIDEAPGKYSDRGYNVVFGTRCEAASHEHAY